MPACLLLVGTNVLAFHDTFASPPINSSQLIYTTVTSIQSSWSVEMDKPKSKTSTRMIDSDPPMTISVDSPKSDFPKGSSHHVLSGRRTTSKAKMSNFLGLGIGANSTRLHTSTASTAKPNSSATLSMSTGLGTPQYLDLPRMLVAAIAVVPLILLVIV